MASGGLSSISTPVATPPRVQKRTPAEGDAAARAAVPVSTAEPVAETDDDFDEEIDSSGHSGWEVWARILLIFSGTSALGYALSAMFHTVAMVILSVVIVKGNLGLDRINTLVGFQSDVMPQVIGLDQELETRIDLEGGESTPLAASTVSLESLAPQAMANNAAQMPGFSSIPRLDLPGNGDGKGKKEGEGTKGIKGGFAMPSNGKAVTKGSFTAWTVPEDPRPFESYLIVIQVKMNREKSHLPDGDVSGFVRGTDHYYLNINPYTSTYFPKTKQLVIRIPGAESRVRDTIQVRSKFLKEEQTLEIEF